MQTPLILTRDINGYVAYGLPFITDNDYQYNMVIAANTVTTVTVPGVSTQRFEAIFSFGSGVEVFVSNVASPTIALPTSTPTQTLAQQNPVARNVAGASTLQFISANDDAYITVSFYALQ